MFYIDPLESRCSLISHNQVSQFPESIVEGLIVLGLSVLYGICNLDDAQNPVFIIYDACVIDAENICAKLYSERRTMCSYFINQYRENLAKVIFICSILTQGNRVPLPDCSSSGWMMNERRKKLGEGFDETSDKKQYTDYLSNPLSNLSSVLPAPGPRRR